MGQVNRRILIVDDNKAIHGDFEKILSRQDKKNVTLESLKKSVLNQRGSKMDPAEQALIQYSISSAYQGEEALEMLVAAKKEGNPFSLVFMDMRMPPGWNGLRTIEEMWKVCPGTEMVICSAYSDYSWQEIVDTLGVSQHLLILQKPFDVTEVQQIALSLTTRWSQSNMGPASAEKLKFTEFEGPVNDFAPVASGRKNLRAKKSGTYHHGDLRSAIVLAGLKILNSKGADQITLREVAKLLRVSQTAPYRHFQSKEGLLIAIAQEGFYKLTQILRQIPLRLQSSPQAQLAEAGKVYLNFALNNREHFRMMFEPSIFSDNKKHPDFERAVRETFDALGQIVASCQISKKIKDGDSLRRTLVLWSKIHGLSTLFLSHRLAFLDTEVQQLQQTMSELMSEAAE